MGSPFFLSWPDWNASGHGVSRTQAPDSGDASERSGARLRRPIESELGAQFLDINVQDLVVLRVVHGAVDQVHARRVPAVCQQRLQMV